jgi:lysophospholipase L1-like esterase
MQRLRLTTLVVAMLVTGGPAVAADPVVENPAEPTYYLALGDSIAAGWEPIGDPERNYMTRMSYPNQLWLMARATHPNLELVNLSCPGENTETIAQVSQYCDYEQGSQLAEALAFIEEHGDQLAFITIDIGFNDFPCSDDLSCVFPGIENIAERLPPILATLKEAAPDVPIVGMNVYDPFVTFWLTGEEELAKQSVWALKLINETLEDAYADAGMSVADVESAFAIDDWETMVPMAGFGEVPLNVALVCERSWMCFPPPLGPDRHPNVLGSRVIAEAFADELDIVRP